MPGRSLKLCANLSFLFADVPFADRFRRVARAGSLAWSTCFPMVTTPPTGAGTESGLSWAKDWLGR